MLDIQQARIFLNSDLNVNIFLLIQVTYLLTNIAKCEYNEAAWIELTLLILCLKAITISTWGFLE